MLKLNFITKITKYQINFHIGIFVLLYLSNLTLQQIVEINNDLVIYLYPEKDLGIKNICALSGTTRKYIGNNVYTNKYLYLKSHCGKTEKCYETEKEIVGDKEVSIFQCGEKILLQKIGDECGINGECFTGLCNYGKCSSIGNDEDCTLENDASNPEKVCNPGHWCHEYDPLNHLYRCVAYIGEGEYYDELDGKLCRIGLEPDPALFDKCTKIGTKDIGESSPNPMLCKSGFSLGYENDEVILDDPEKFKCFSVIKDSKCEFSDEDGGYYCNPQAEGIDQYVVEIKIECNSNNVCPYSKGKENSFKEYISALNEININDVYGDEHRYHLVGYGDDKLCQAYLKYKNYDDLYAMGILNDDGNVNENKKDEWEFFWRFNSSKYFNKKIFLFVFILLI